MNDSSLYIYKWLIILIFFILAVFQVSYDIGKEPIKIWDESSSARNAVEMLQSGDFLVVRYNGEPDHHDSKPPLNTWLKVISYKIFGINEFAVRFPTIVAAVLTFIAIICFCLFYLKNYWVALLSILIISITPGYMRYHVARNGDPDTLLIFFVTGYILFIFILLEEYPRNRIKNLVFSGVFVVLAVYTKSIAGLAPLAGMAVYALTRKKFYRLIKDYRFHLTWVGGLFIIGFYYLLREYFDPGYIQEGLLREISLFGDYPGKPKHPEFGYYFSYLVNKGFFPFAYAFPAFLLLMPFIGFSNQKLKRLWWYSLLGIMVFLLGQSLSVTKNFWYIAPVFSFLWVFYSISIFEIVHQLGYILKNRKIRFVLVVLSILGLSWGYFILYGNIFSDNQNYKDYTYAPEREGEFLRQVKEEMPGLDTVFVITYHPIRQLEFYQKKYKYEDNTRVFINKVLSNNLINQHVLVCQNKIEKMLEKKYSYDLILEGKYGKLYFIKNKNDK